MADVNAGPILKVFIHVVAMLADNGMALPVDSLAHDYTYNGDGTIATDTVVHNGLTYKNTYTYTAGALTHVTGWIKQ